jgi:hypothetical protein
MQPTGIDLLVPGLLGPIPGLDDLNGVPKAPLIERALSRSSVSEIHSRDYTSTLFQLFGINPDQSGDLPSAPYGRVADGGQVDDGYWLQLSPVHLQPDGDGLLLFDAAHLKLTMDEAQQLAAVAREHFSDRNWKLELYDPERWYLSLDGKPDLQTSPLTEVIGRNIKRYMPTGTEAMEWHSILNELQMLLHMAKVNMLREGRGQLSVNGLWLHGGGSYRTIEQAEYTRVFGNDSLLWGVAHAAGIEAGKLPLESADIAEIKEMFLAVDHRLQRSVLDANPYAWVEAVDSFENWFKPLLEAVRTSQLGHINLYPCDGVVYRIDAKSLRRFWRRQRPFSQFISG